MSDQPVDSGKRTWLIASGCAGVVGGTAAAVPFISSFQPSERARAAGAPVEVDVGSLKPGEKTTVEWRGKPVWIVRRTPEQLAELPKIEGRLADPKSQRNPALTPEYAHNQYRSIKPELFVAVGITGPAAFSAPATVQSLTWPVASSRTCRRLTTSRYLRTCT
jgi:ubiquinol-cytochrome c reductase iron-sulfur subunit